MSFWFSPRIFEENEDNQVYSVFKYGNFRNLKIIELIKNIYGFSFEFPKKYWELIRKIDIFEESFFQAKIDVSQFCSYDLFPSNLLDRLTRFEKLAISGFFKVISDFDISYYDKFVTKYIFALNNLDCFKIDRNKFFLFEKSKMFKSCVPSRFLLKNNTHKFEYHLNTVTGRSAIKSKTSFNIMKCPKDMKHFMKSKWKNGEIIAVDYGAIDIRSLMLYLGENVYGDPYQKLLNYSKIDLPRNVIKIIFLGLLYGANPNVLSSKTGVSGSILLNLKITLDELFDSVLSSIEGKNIFGRPIHVDEKKMLSYLGQSTSADICHNALYDIVTFCLKNNTASRPIGVIHDTILFDWNPDENNFVENVCDIMQTRYVAGNKYKFPIKIGEI